MVRFLSAKLICYKHNLLFYVNFLDVWLVQEGECSKVTLITTTTLRGMGDEHALASSTLPMSLKFKPSTVARSSNH